MNKICNLAAKILIVAILIFCIIIICKYILTDNQLWKSPYDQELMDQEITFEGKSNDLAVVIYNVEQCVNKWIEEEKLISVDVHVNNDDNNNITRCHFTYDIENVDDYLGFCEVTCYYNNEQWVIKNASKEYLQDDFNKNSTMLIHDILDKYIENIKFLRDNDFFGGTDAEIVIRNDKVGIIIWGLDEKKHRCILQRMSK